MKYDREIPGYRPIDERLKHYKEFITDFDEEGMRSQGYRCMNCGVPFCQSGCPLGNIIPDFNDFVKDNNWEGALARLHSTNNFPEVTGRICPAPCESSCVLGINEPPVTIKLIERSIADRGIENGWVEAQPPAERTGKSVAVVGSGPAGLAAAQQLNRAGHTVTVYERADTPGGLLVYGIPDFKMEKDIVAKRVKQMEEEGVTFVCSTEIGKDMPAQKLVDDNDAVLLCLGSTAPRDIPVPGRELKGIEFAMDFLPQQNRRVAGRAVEEEEILATGKRVVVLGGGDTGSDCIGTSLRQGCSALQNFELLPKPPADYNPKTPWPTDRPMILNISSSHEEGGERDWSVLTKSFSGEDGQVTTVHAVRIKWLENPEPGKAPFEEIPGSEFTIDADLVLLALGFVHPEHTIPTELKLDLDGRGNIQAAYDGPDQYRTNHPKVFAAGDARRGQSLVVWAIHEGREAARTVDLALQGHSDLPSAHSYGYDSVAVPTLAD
jgi:glutamate synthase (NADPH/NADH) small chain